MRRGKERKGEDEDEEAQAKERPEGKRMEMVKKGGKQRRRACGRVDRGDQARPDWTLDTGQRDEDDDEELGRWTLETGDGRLEQRQHQQLQQQAKEGRIGDEESDPKCKRSVTRDVGTLQPCRRTVGLGRGTLCVFWTPQDSLVALVPLVQGWTVVDAPFLLVVAAVLVCFCPASTLLETVRECVWASLMS